MVVKSDIFRLEFRRTDVKSNSLSIYFYSEGHGAVRTPTPHSQKVLGLKPQAGLRVSVQRLHVLPVPGTLATSKGLG